MSIIVHSLCGLAKSLNHVLPQLLPAPEEYSTFLFPASSFVVVRTSKPQQIRGLSLLFSIRQTKKMSKNQLMFVY